MFANKRLIPIFVVIFVDLLGFSIILPLLPYFAGHVDASPQMIGFLVATYSICQFISAPILGGLSDRFGRRPVLLFSQLGSFTGFLLLGSAFFLPHTIVWLFVARAIDGCSGGNLTIAQAYISDVTEPDERTKSYAMIGVAFGLGFLVGPAFGGFLSRFGYAIPAYAAACFSLSSIVATILLLPETEHQPDENRRLGLSAYTRVFEYFSLPELRTLLLVFFFFALPFSLYVTMFALFADVQLKLTAEQAGYFLAFVGLLGIIWQGGVVAPVAKRIGERRALQIGLLLCAIGQFSIVGVDVWWKLFHVSLFLSLGTALTRPAITSLITKVAPQNRRGGVLGVMSSIESLSRIIAPPLGGWIIGGMHPTWLGYVGGALATLGVMLIASWRGDA